MPNIIYKDWCPECGGSGHGKNCGNICAKMADPALAFLVGCCERCGGDGMIVIKKGQGDDAIDSVIRTVVEQKLKVKPDPIRDAIRKASKLSLDE